MSRFKIETVAPLRPEEATYRPDIYSRKGRKKIVNEAKRLVRTSLEYEDYIFFLKTYVDMVKCAVYSNIKNDGKGKMSIEIHHDPLKLDDIVAIVLNKQIIENTFVSEFQLANEVARLHYQNKVGLIPLSVSVHELVTHSPDRLKIPLQLIYGNYTDFLREYDAYITEDLDTELHGLRQRLKDRYDYTKESLKIQFDELEPTYTILKVNGQAIPLPVPVEEEEATHQIA